MIGSMPLGELLPYAVAIACITLPGAIAVAALERALEAFSTRRPAPRTVRRR